MDMNLKLEIKLEKNTMEAVKALADSIKGVTLTVDSPQVINVAPHQPQATPPQDQPPVVDVPPSTAYDAPVPQPPVQDADPVSQTLPVLQPVPDAVPQTPPPVQTQAPVYTPQQLAIAATQLMDAGRQNDVLALLARFNVQALTQLTPDMYGSFATELRLMGAKI